MKRIINIKGMTCEHCRARVEKELNSISGVKAQVDLENNQAIADIPNDISDQILRDAIGEAGYDVISITNQV